jgi:hypothetical protein
MMILLLTFIAHSLYNYINSKLIRCNAHLSSSSFKLFDATLVTTELNEEDELTKETDRTNDPTTKLDEEPEIFLFNESFDVNLFKLKLHETERCMMKNNNSNYEFINELNKLYKNNCASSSSSSSFSATTKTNPTDYCNYNILINSIDISANNCHNYFYENDLDLLNLNSMKIDMDVNNLEQLVADQTTLNDCTIINDNDENTNAFIDMIDNMDFIEETECEFLEEIEDSNLPIVFDSITSALSSRSSLSSVVTSDPDASFSVAPNFSFTHSLVNSRLTPMSRIKMQNSYGLLKRRMMATKRKHLNNLSLNNSEIHQDQHSFNHDDNANSISIGILTSRQQQTLKDKRFRTRNQRVKHARKFYQRQRTSSTKLSIDLNDHSLTKLKDFQPMKHDSNPSQMSNNNNETVTADATVDTSLTKETQHHHHHHHILNDSKSANFKLYKPSFKVEKLLNDSRGMKKYFIDYDYDCLMTATKQQQSHQHIAKTFSLNNLSSIMINSNNNEQNDNSNNNNNNNSASFSSIQLNKLLDLSECDASILDEIRHSFLRISQNSPFLNDLINMDNLNEDENGQENKEEEEEDEYEYDEEKKSISSISNKCSSGYLSDF